MYSQLAPPTICLLCVSATELIVCPCSVQRVPAVGDKITGSSGAQVVPLSEEESFSEAMDCEENFNRSWIRQV